MLKEARQELVMIALELEIMADKTGGAKLRELSDRLIALSETLWKRPPVTRAKQHSRSLDEETRELIREYHEKYPGLPQHNIAAGVGVNQGAVSVVLRELKEGGGNVDA